MKLAASTAALACAMLGCEARAQSFDSGAQTPALAQDGDVAATAAPLHSPVPVAMPPGWAALPAVADAGLAAARAGDRPIVVRSWGEASLGCFATVVEITGTRDEHLARVAETFRATLANGAQLDGWTFTDGPTPTTAEASAIITRGAMRGSVRGRLATDAAGLPHGAFAACFYNDRDPARCQAACTGLLASLESPKVSP